MKVGYLVRIRWATLTPPHCWSKGMLREIPLPFKNSLKKQSLQSKFFNVDILLFSKDKTTTSSSCASKEWSDCAKLYAYSIAIAWMTYNVRIEGWMQEVHENDGGTKNQDKSYNIHTTIILFHEEMHPSCGHSHGHEGSSLHLLSLLSSISILLSSGSSQHCRLKNKHVCWDSLESSLVRLF